MHKKRTKYTRRNQIMVVEEMNKGHCRYCETIINFEISEIAENGKNPIKSAGEIYLEEGREA